ncbi:hypothetical protein DIPPA_59941 [Diplonema papillatum]|nr:hypothetical protein DIPPA_59941 [Diplonema papillatum]
MQRALVWCALCCVARAAINEHTNPPPGVTVFSSPAQLHMVTFNDCGSPTAELYFYNSLFGVCQPYKDKSFLLTSPKQCGASDHYLLQWYEQVDCKGKSGEQQVPLNGTMCNDDINAVQIGFEKDSAATHQDVCQFALAAEQLMKAEIATTTYSFSGCDSKFLLGTYKRSAADLMPTDPIGTCLNDTFMNTLSIGTNMSVCYQSSYFTHVGSKTCAVDNAATPEVRLDECSNTAQAVTFSTLLGISKKAAIKVVCYRAIIDARFTPLDTCGQDPGTAHDACAIALSGEEQNRPEKKPSSDAASSIGIALVLLVLVAAVVMLGASHHYRRAHSKGWTAVDTVEVPSELDMFDDVVEDISDASPIETTPALVIEDDS